VLNFWLIDYKAPHFAGIVFRADLIVEADGTLRSPSARRIRGTPAASYAATRKCDVRMQSLPCIHGDLCRGIARRPAALAAADRARLSGRTALQNQGQRSEARGGDNALSACRGYYPCRSNIRGRGLGAREPAVAAGELHQRAAADRLLRAGLHDQRQVRAAIWRPRDERHLAAAPRQHFTNSHNKNVRANATRLYFRCKVFATPELAAYVEAVSIAAYEYPWNRRNEWTQHWALDT